MLYKELTKNHLMAYKRMSKNPLIKWGVLKEVRASPYKTPNFIIEWITMKENGKVVKKKKKLNYNVYINLI